MPTIDRKISVGLDRARFLECCTFPAPLETKAGPGYSQRAEQLAEWAPGLPLHTPPPASTGVSWLQKLLPGAALEREGSVCRLASVGDPPLLHSHLGRCKDRGCGEQRPVAQGKLERHHYCIEGSVEMLATERRNRSLS